MDNFEDGSYQCLPGPALIAKVLAGRCKMNYSRAAVGSGTVPEGVNPNTVREPPGYVMDAKISAVTNPVDGECQVTVQINSSDVKEGFYATGVLLYADDPDLGQVPYTYLRLEDGPEWIRPASGAVGKLATFDLIAAVGAVKAVSASINPEAIATVACVEQLLRSHDADPSAHASRYYVAATRPRDPNKPLYGLDSEVTVALETGPYTGDTELGVVVSGVLLDAKNLSFDGAAPGGTIILKTEVQQNG